MAQKLIVHLDLLRADKYARVICYPEPSPEQLDARLTEVSELGVDQVEFSGRTTIHGLHVLGKGTVGIILAGITPKGTVALKIRRTDARRADMSQEARMLAKANSLSVGPRIYGSTRNVISMQFVNGLPLADWLSHARPKVDVRRVVGQVLLQAYKLDKIGLDHGELSRAHKNVLVARSKNAWIVDFESASVGRKPRNVTSVVQNFLFGNLAKYLSWMKLNKRGILAAARVHKMDPSEKSLRILMNRLGCRPTNAK